MLRGDYIDFNIVTLAMLMCLLLCQVVKLNGATKLLTFHLTLDFSCRKLTRMNLKSNLCYSDADTSCFFTGDMKQVNYVCKEKVGEK